jgi:saccharopine dehydrogenase-like NADP-dependent oxidoreductase
MKITILGAGRSAGFLIEYLAKLSIDKGFPPVVVIDRVPFSGFTIQADLRDAVNWQVADLDDDAFLDNTIAHSDLVVSLLPVFMHLKVAKLCLKHAKHLATASYVSDGMKLLHNEAEAKGLFFLNEMGLDPGIDHLSSSEMIKEILQWGGEIVGYESYCGGLVNPESEKNPNPWGYKFSWNPRNVVLAGQGGDSVWLNEGCECRVSPEQLFKHSKSIQIPSNPSAILDAYPNRDSLSYRDLYRLNSAKTLIRGTLRRDGFCSAWQILVDAGFTSPEKNNEMFGNQWFEKLTGFSTTDSWTNWLFENGKIDEDNKAKLDYLKLEEAVKYENESNSDVLERLLMQRWKLEDTDRDEVIMYHSIRYEMDGRNYKMSSTMKLIGEGNGRTAMAKSVGLTLALGVELLINNEIAQRGVVVPIFQSWGNKVLQKLKDFGVQFDEFIEINPN